MHEWFRLFSFNTHKLFMKTRLVGLLVLLLIGVAACKYDDDALWNKLNSLEERIASLEDKLSQMNSDISSMSTIVNALENKISISKVEETEDGYKITFTDDKEITLKNGTDGKEEMMPQPSALTKRTAFIIGCRS